MIGPIAGLVVLLAALGAAVTMVTWVVRWADERRIALTPTAARRYVAAVPKRAASIGAHQQRLGVTAEDAGANLAANLSAALGPCSHPRPVPVELVLTGEIVAALCPDCDRQLPARWALTSPRVLATNPVVARRWDCERPGT